LLDLKRRRSRQKQEQHDNQQAYIGAIAERGAWIQAQKAQEYLQSGDPILLKEGLQWLVGQEASLRQALPVSFDDRPENAHLDTLVGVCEQLLRLHWSPLQVRQDLRTQCGSVAIASLSYEQLQRWLGHLKSRGRP
jgi:hypothetical protein